MDANASPLRFTVILDVRYGGSSFGTTEDVIEAATAAEAERLAIEQWTAARPDRTYHALLVVEEAHDA
jgi:hypothetical protein